MIPRYVRFLIVGGIVGLFSLAVRQVVGWLAGEATQADYSVSVLIGYAAGILLSFVLNRAITFNGGSWAKFPAFVAIALIGMAVTWGLSVAIRFGLPLEAFGAFAGTIAFGVATVLATGVTYPLNARLLK